MNIWFKSKCVWTSPVSGVLGFPVTGSGEMWRSKAARGCFLGLFGFLGSCSSLFFIVLQMFLIKGCFNLKTMK